jgi:hypothetical protein
MPPFQSHPNDQDPGAPEHTQRARFDARSDASPESATENTAPGAGTGLLQLKTEN